ncbi:MAG: lytic murein transglycosylase [Hyphomicrobiaceae bacterium]|nr:lytic murein transglycosylase [Hyphomicrobiaceae bacterium]
MRCVTTGLAAAAVLLAGIVSPGPAAAAPACQNTGSYEVWLAAFRKEAASAGISRATISAALDGMALDPGIIARDRRQSFFAQTFLEVVDKLATRNRVQSGSRAMQRHAAIFQRAEREFGVPAAVISAFWALESDFGVGMGKLVVLRSLATLAYDCRRGEMFRGELMAALRIIDRGDLRPSEMIGSWAGELGQTQFLPTHYFKHAVDYDGDGRRDLLRSPADVIGSSAAFMHSLGWQRGQPWLQEVRVTAELPWKEADIAISHPRSQWAGWGITLPDGKPLPRDGMPASLHLPMGRNGPAFLAYANFHVFLKWNQALNYATTAAYLATRLDGAPGLGKGRSPVAPFGMAETRELQRLLSRAGLYGEEIDGKLGAMTRAAVKAAQVRLGLPADSYPTPELVERLRGR